MKTANKIFLIVMACLLVVGAMCLAFGIMLGGNLSAVFKKLLDDLAPFLTTLNLIAGW